jgi:hypothetical protein
MIVSVVLTAEGRVFDDQIIRPGHKNGDEVAFPVKIKSVSAGLGFGGAVSSEGEVFVWGTGSPYYDQAEKPCPVVICKKDFDLFAPDGTNATRKTANYEPHKVAGLKNITHISMGFRIAAAMDKSGQIFVWTHANAPIKVGEVKPSGSSKEYSCDSFAEGFAPYWAGIKEAAAKYADSKHPIPESLLAAIAVQETGGAGAGFPKNIQETNSKGFGMGPFQIDFNTATKQYPKITPAEVFAPDALVKYPKLDKTFKNKGITPADAKNDPAKTASLVAKMLVDNWKHFGSLDVGITAYNGGYTNPYDPKNSSPKNWAKGDNPYYLESVTRHQDLILDAIKRCGTP